MSQERWQKLTEWPLVTLSVGFLLVYGYQVLWNLRGDGPNTSDFILTVIWALFLIDYVMNLILAPDRKRWFFRHLLDLAVVALPMLRPLRLLRLLSIVSLLHRSTVVAFRGHVALYVVASTILLVFVGGLAVLDAEQNVRGANITNFGDALWWAFATITTVGYGDFYPVSPPGRLVAVGLMACGVALLGSVTALLASWFVDQVRESKAPSEPPAGS